MAGICGSALVACGGQDHPSRNQNPYHLGAFSCTDSLHRLWAEPLAKVSLYTETPGIQGDPQVAMPSWSAGLVKQSDPTVQWGRTGQWEV